MTPDQIKAAVDAGKRVDYLSPFFTVKRSEKGDFRVECNTNNYSFPLEYEYGDMYAPEESFSIVSETDLNLLGSTIGEGDSRLPVYHVPALTIDHLTPRTAAAIFASDDTRYWGHIAIFDKGFFLRFAIDNDFIPDDLKVIRAWFFDVCGGRPHNWLSFEERGPVIPGLHLYCR
jgi:hypothetical protein